MIGFAPFPRVVLFRVPLVWRFARISDDFSNIFLLLSIRYATVGTKAQFSLVVATSKNWNGKASVSEYIASAEVAATPKIVKPVTCHSNASVDQPRVVAQSCFRMP